MNFLSLRRLEASLPATLGQRFSVDLGIRLIALLTIFLALSAQLVFVLVRQINWDEFYFLARIYEYRRGEIGNALQTFHVHLFQWLTFLPFDEIGQIVVARLVMFGLLLGTLFMLFRLGCLFASRQAALLAVAAYALCSNVVAHGASFRFDPIATFLLISALAILGRGHLAAARTVLAGILVALAVLITVKAVFYFPAIAALCLWRLSESRNRGRLGALVVGAAAGLAAYAALYFAHHAAIQNALLTSSEAFLSHSASTMLLSGALVRNWPYLSHSLMSNPLLWLGIGGGVVAALYGLIDPARRWRMGVVLSFAFPLAAIAFYRNAFPYYYVFALAPAALLFAVAVDALALSPGRMLRLSVLTAILGILGIAIAWPQTQQNQRAVLRAVHEIFPEPVPYIDRCSMIGRFSKVGFFMSTWLLETYRATGQPSFPELVAKAHPVFVLANSEVLARALTGKAGPDFHALTPRDAAMLRHNFIPHWGPVWVAGKHFERLGVQPRRFEILIPGDYTLEAGGALLIDGNRIKAGRIVHLAAGYHEVSSLEGTPRASLRWGRHLPVPAARPPEGKVFDGF